MSAFQSEVREAYERIVDRKGDWIGDLEWLVDLALESEFGK